MTPTRPNMFHEDETKLDNKSVLTSGTTCAAITLNIATDFATLMAALSLSVNFVFNNHYLSSSILFAVFIIL